ncbi:MAG: gephyrin-like molybdotransferase Glp [Alphaproteobacteria bacterium]
MLSVAEARRRILDAMPLLPAEQVGLLDGLGRVLAEDLESRRAQPPMAVSAMDGYAVRAADVATVPVQLRIVGEVPAGSSHDGTVGAGEAVRIFTGAPVPDGADAIVIQEDTDRDGDRVTVKEAAPLGQFVRPKGLDFSAGDVLLRAGRVLTARDVGLAAAMNRAWLMVRRRPRVAILATGDEIVMPGDPVGPNQIVSSNGLALAATVRALGGEPVLLGIAPDDREALGAMADGARGADLLLTTGGASVGDHDLVQSVLGERGLDVDFWRIAMRPGKPLMFGQIGGVPMLGLPGNPVSTLVCAMLFVYPALARMAGSTDDLPVLRSARLAVPLPANDRREDYLRATMVVGDDGRCTVTPFRKQDSSMMAPLARAGCLVLRPPHAPAASEGDTVACIPLPEGVLRP